MVARVLLYSFAQGGWQWCPPDDEIELNRQVLSGNLDPGIHRRTECVRVRTTSVSGQGVRYQLAFFDDRRVEVANLDDVPAPIRDTIVEVVHNQTAVDQDFWAALQPELARCSRSWPRADEHPELDLYNGEWLVGRRGKLGYWYALLAVRDQPRLLRTPMPSTSDSSTTKTEARTTGEPVARLLPAEPRRKTPDYPAPTNPHHQRSVARYLDTQDTPFDLYELVARAGTGRQHKWYRRILLAWKFQDVIVPRRGGVARKPQDLLEAFGGQAKTKARSYTDYLIDLVWTPGTVNPKPTQEHLIRYLLDPEQHVEPMLTERDIDLADDVVRELLERRKPPER